MNEILINILSVIITAVILPLITLAGTNLIKLINSKIEDAISAKLLTSVTTIVLNSVRCVFQTYVETLKQEGKFDAQSQAEALKKAKDIALSQLDKEKRDFVATMFGDLDTWLNTQIESSINILKNT